MWSTHCRYVLYRHNKRFFDKFVLRQPLSLVLTAPTFATVASAFIPGSTHPCHSSSLAYAGLPHTNEHLCDHVFIIILLTPDLLSSRPGWNRRWGYHCSAQITLCESHHSVGNIITVPSGINPRATVASIKVLFRGIKACIQPHFALSHAWVLGILHYHECCIAHMQGNSPAFQLNATVRGVFIPDSTLEFLPIFSSLKCIKSSIFSGFLHSLRWFGPRKLPRYFQA